MGIYLGSSDKLKVVLNGISYRLNLPNLTSIVDRVRLLSSDGHILKDSFGTYLIPRTQNASVANNVLLSKDGCWLADCNGIYLVPKDYTSSTVGKVLLSKDNYVLTDRNGMILTFKESE